MVTGSGPFFDAFASNREAWNLIAISAFDTPSLERSGRSINSGIRLAAAIAGKKIDLMEAPDPRGS